MSNPAMWIPIAFLVGMISGALFVEHHPSFAEGKILQEIAQKKKADCEEYLPRNYRCELVITAEPVVGSK